MEEIYPDRFSQSSYFGAVGGWWNIAITLIDPDFGEQTAQACENAC